MPLENELLREPSTGKDTVYANILSRVSDAIVALDNDCHYTFVNEQAAALFGRTPADLVGKHIWTEFPAGVGQPFQLYYEEAMREQKPCCFEDYYAPLDRWFENRLYPSSDGITIFFKEITGWKKSEEEHHKTKNHLEAMINALPDLMFRIDQGGVIREFCSSFPELLYIQPDKFLGRKVVDMLPEEPARIIMEALDEAAEKGSHRGATYSLQMPQGVMWYELSVASMGAPGKPEKNFIMLARDITDRKIAEEAIRQSEEKFRSIVETSQEWIWETDLSWNHTYSNERVADLLGYSLDEFLGFNSMQLIHQEDIVELEAILPGLIDRKEGWRSWVLRWRHKDGSYRFLESNAEPILNLSGELVGYRGSDRDITDRKNVERKLRESEELFSLLMRYTPVYTFIKQIEGDKSRVLQLSDNFIDMLGKPADELRGCTMDEMFPPDFARKITDDDIAVVKAGKIIQLDEELNGISYVTIKFPIQREGKDNLLAGYTIDITERKLAEKSLSKYADIINNMQVGLYVYQLENPEDDRSIRMVAANPKSASLLGLTAQDVVGSTIDEIFPNLRKAGIPEKFANVVRTGQAIEVEEFFYFDQNIKDAVFNFKAFPLPDNCVGVLFEDITLRKQAEMALQGMNIELEQRVEDRTAELNDLNKELQAFNYSISHDLRAPLIRIKGYADILLDICASKLTEEEVQYFLRLKNSCNRLDGHIDALLKLYKIDHGSIYIEPVNLSDLALTISNYLHDLNPDRKVAFTIADGLVVKADKTLMAELMDSLISNAWKYTLENEDARIEVGVTKTDGKEVYFIRDNGVGFNIDQVENIFTPFLRLHSEDSGLGIGLASVNRIIRLHGGKIWADSREGEGATFYFTLQ